MRLLHHIACAQCDWTMRFPVRWVVVLWFHFHVMWSHPESFDKLKRGEMQPHELYDNE